MAAIRRLDFVMRMFGPPTKCIHCAEFGCHGRDAVVSTIYKFLFCALGLKCLFTPPKSGVLGHFTPPPSVGSSIISFDDGVLGFPPYIPTASSKPLDGNSCVQRRLFRRIRVKY